MEMTLRRPWRAWVWLLTTTVHVGCSDTIGPNSIAFTTEPAGGIAGEQIKPSIEVTVQDALGNPLTGAVSLTLDPNPCSWRLSGTLLVELQAGVARFPDVAVDQIGRGYTLRASFGTMSVTSRRFDIASPIDDQPLIHETLLCTKPNQQSDAESLTWVPEDDAFWLADDNRGAIFQVDRLTGRTLSYIPSSEFAAALPEASTCDDGDGDPNTTCSYLDEFEQLTFDPPSGILYVANTVNTPSDRPAIFRLRKQACAGCFTIEDWQPLPEGPSYGGLVVVAGEALVAHENRIYGYDFATNQVATVDVNGDSLPPLYATQTNIVGLGFDGSSMWILTELRLLYRVQWSTKTELARYDLAPFSIAVPKGLEAIRDTVYVLEGNAPNPINVFTIR